MADLNHLGNITANCPGCYGARSSFEYKVEGAILGVVILADLHFRLFRCAGCGRGALGVIEMFRPGASYPSAYSRLIGFTPEAKERLPLPKDVPKGIQNEFREAEMCLENDCYRASAAMFRSVLDKTLRANGYKTKRENLQQQIDEAAKDGVITEARKRKAHDEIRVLGNDVLHDEWHEISEEEVEAAHRYTQRVLEDFYDDRESVLKLLRQANRVPEEDKNPQSQPPS